MDSKLIKAIHYLLDVYEESNPNYYTDDRVMEIDDILKELEHVETNQVKLLRRVQDYIGVNIVSCGSCEAVLLCETEQDIVKCPDCNGEFEQHDLSDLVY